MVLDPQGRVSGTIKVRDVIAKKRGGRRIPMHPDLRRALERLAQTREPVGAIIRSYRGSHLKANSVVNWFVALFKELGYEGCSSHSGRRSFITIAARNIHRSGCSLAPVRATEQGDFADLTATDDDVREVLDTGLFSSRGEHRMGWAHQSYGEFLAALYLKDKRVPARTNLQVLTHPTSGLIPQLTVVAAWTASLSAELRASLIAAEPWARPSCGARWSLNSSSANPPRLAQGLD
jgi:hypothetical protein